MSNKLKKKKKDFLSKAQETAVPKQKRQKKLEQNRGNTRVQNAGSYGLKACTPTAAVKVRKH